MDTDRIELFNRELYNIKSNLRVIEITNSMGLKGKGERVTYECIKCKYSDNITSKSLRSGKGKLCPVCQTFRKVTNWTIDLYIKNKGLKIRRISDVFSAKDKFDYECIDCGYVTKDFTYDRLKRCNKEICKNCKNISENSKSTRCRKLTEDLFDSRVKLKSKPYTRIGNLIKKTNAKPGVKLRCNICNTEFTCQDAGYVSISDHNQCPTCKKNNQIFDNYNQVVKEFDTNNMSILEKAKLSYKIANKLKDEKERDVRLYLESKDAILISEFIDIYSKGIIKCINCGNEKTYESLDTIYTVENLCNCSRYKTYQHENVEGMKNELLQNTDYIKKIDNLNKEKEKKLRHDYKLEGIIYVAKNIKNDFKYVGQTIQTLEKRKYSHEWEAINNKDNNRFHNALAYYGIDNFEWSIIDKGNTRYELDEKEKYWIKELRTWINAENSKGYNTDLGGNSGGWSDGENNSKAKLTERDAEYIKEEFLFSDATPKELSEIYNISVSSIYRVLSGKSFKKVRMDLNEDINKKISKEPSYLVYWKMRYEKGMTDKEIAEETGKTVKHIQTIISQANAKIGNIKARKNKKEQKEQRSKIIELYKLGKNIQEIVNLGYPKTTVKRTIDVLNKNQK